MKTIRIALGFAVAVLFTGCATSAGRTEGASTARIEAVEGSAEVSREGRGWAPAERSEILRAGDRARTGSNGKIDFHLGKYGGVLTLMPSSTMEFEQLGPSASDSRIVAVVNLTEGRVVGDTLKLPPNTRLQVKTPRAAYEIP